MKYIEVFEDKIPGIRDLALEIFPETYKNLLASTQIEYMLDMMYSEQSLAQQFSEGCQFFIIYDNDKAIGYGSISVSESTSSLHKIYVNHSYQGKGVGKEFISFLENESKNNGAQKIQLYVKRDNIAQFFYQKLGYQVIAEVDKAIGNGYFMNDYIMEKLLG
ncbi:MAG: GNAT family N-acetyltransferase [Bacteroidota bacterium]